MKKPVLFIGIMCLVFCLTACYGNTGKENDNNPTQNVQESKTEEESKSNEEKETSVNDTSVKNEYEIDDDTAEDSEETSADAIIDGIDMDNPPMNWGTPDGPEVAAENYYANTIFELVSLDVLQSSREYVKFSVISKKGGELVDPNRTIQLRYEDGSWNVINEGY